MYIKSDTLLFADVFKNFRNVCLQIYEIDSAHFLSTPGLTWKDQRKTKVKWDLLISNFKLDLFNDMLLMVEKDIMKL